MRGFSYFHSKEWWRFENTSPSWQSLSARSQVLLRVVQLDAALLTTVHAIFFVDVLSRFAWSNGRFSGSRDARALSAKNHLWLFWHQRAGDGHALLLTTKSSEGTAFKADVFNPHYFLSVQVPCAFLQRLTKPSKLRWSEIRLSRTDHPHCYTLKRLTKLKLLNNIAYLRTEKYANVFV